MFLIAQHVYGAKVLLFFEMCKSLHKKTRPKTRFSSLAVEGAR
jgi:hypothetical protein